MSALLSNEELDPTTKRAFTDEHTERLLAWEYLQRALTDNTTELTDEELSDRLAAADKYCYNTLLSCKRRLAQYGKH